MPSADPLAEVLSLLSAKSLLSASLRARGGWSVRFPSEGVKLNVLIKGACSLILQGEQTAVPLRAGDCYLLVNCKSYVLCSDPSLPPVPWNEICANGTDRSVNLDGGEPDVFVIGGRITFDEADANLFLEALPSIIRVGGASREAPAIHWLLTRLAEEWSAALPGAALAVDHLAQLLFVEVIRAWLSTGDGPESGWLRAITDRRVGAAIRLLHGDPSRRWQLQDLARAAGMSRSNFALRFKQLAGVSPLDYLLRWRMRLGAKALRAGLESISTIAFSLGYESGSAFCNAFKRVMGIPPQQYRRDHRREVPPPARPVADA
jgi:AraC-like DNA-binding protein